MDHLCIFLELPISALAREGKLAIFLINVFAIDDQACIWLWELPFGLVLKYHSNNHL